MCQHLHEHTFTNRRQVRRTQPFRVTIILTNANVVVSIVLPVLFSFPGLCGDVWSDGNRFFLNNLQILLLNEHKSLLFVFFALKSFNPFVSSIDNCFGQSDSLILIFLLNQFSMNTNSFIYFFLFIQYQNRRTALPFISVDSVNNHFSVSFTILSLHPKRLNCLIAFVQFRSPGQPQIKFFLHLRFSFSINRKRLNFVQLLIALQNQQSKIELFGYFCLFFLILFRTICTYNTVRLSFSIAITQKHLKFFNKVIFFRLQML